MNIQEQYFPLAFAAIERLMEHGATTHRDDQEWREHTMLDHLGHALDHANELKREHGDYYDPGSGQHQLVHVACRAFMALEVYLGGGTVPLEVK